MRLPGFLLLCGSLLGCESVAASKQRCTAGDLSACERTCAKGVAGEEGCFNAGNAHRQKAGLDYSGSSWKRAREYFGKSCAGGFAVGCFVDAQMIVAPFSDLTASEGATLRAIPDSSLVEYDARLDRACQLGSTEACKSLGDAMIGKKPERAAAAYDKACEKSKDALACKSARKAEVDTAERWRMACTSRVADACDRLGGLLLMVDPQRAVRLFEAEHELRGISDLISVKDFVLDRIRSARERGVPLDTPVTTLEHRFELLPAVRAVQGDVALVEMEGALRRAEPRFVACLGAQPESGTFLAHLVVDRTGDVFQATPSGAAQGVSPGVAACLTAALEAVTVSPPASGRATMDISLTVKAVSPKTQP